MSSPELPKAATELHAASIVIDAACPLAAEPKYLDWYREGGVTLVVPCVGSVESARYSLDKLATWHRRLRERQDLVLVRTGDDVELAKRTDRLGVCFHLQGADPIEDNLDLVDVYKALGVGMVQLTYNSKNRVGDGCEERTDAGLSRFGINLIRRLNEARVIVDCSHTGMRTALEAVEQSTSPVVLSHSNVASVHSSPRNVGGELIDVIAESEGVIGLAGFPGMVAAADAPSLDHFIAHLDVIVERVGIEHVGLGIDYYLGQEGVASLESATQTYEEALRCGVWTSAYPPPPHRYPKGIETPRSLPALTAALLARGYCALDVGMILGGNWLRVMRAVWG